MKKILPVILMCMFAAAPVAAQNATPSAVAATKGQMLSDADGHRVGAVYRVTSDGSVQIVVNAKLVTVPASTLSMVNGKLTTSLTGNQLEPR